jgi:hypothetical protein
MSTYYDGWKSINIKNLSDPHFFIIESWCNKTFGYKTPNVPSQEKRWASNYYENSFYFKYEEDLMLFILRWK